MQNSISAESLAAIQKIIKDDDPTQIRKLRSRKLRVQAAIAYMLSHREQCLNNQNGVIGSLGEHLQKLTGESEISAQTLTAVSRDANWHHAAQNGSMNTRGGWEVTLTPPPELMSLLAASQAPDPKETLQSVPTCSPQQRSLVIVQELLGEGAGVIHAVYRRLRAVCDPDFQ